MITSRKEMNDFLKLEATKLNIHNFWLQKFSGSEFAYIYQYMWILRHLEFYLYKYERNKILFSLPYLFFKIYHRRLSVKYKIFLGPRDAKKGFRLVHLAYFRSWGVTKFGENTTVLPMVLFGKKKPGLPDYNIIQVGNNCYFGTGCTVLGPCNIGNNVTVAAGAVVTMAEIPDNSVVGGVPAKILKFK